MNRWRPRKDHLASVLLIGLGVAIGLNGFRYRMGTLVHMGPGFIPVVLGVIMAAVGLAVGLLAGTGAPAQKKEQELPELPDARGVACILAGVAAFIVFGEYGGLIPAAFASATIAAFGDRKNTWKSAVGLGLAMVVFGIIVFHYGLRVQLPLFGLAP